MSWSITLFRVAGAQIRIHLTFVLLLLWIGIAEYLSGGATAAVDAVAFILAVFACVTLHELGHAVVARRYGISTRDITLLPIGGLAQLSAIPEKPSEEIAIAVAGPAVNVVIAILLILLFGAQIDPAHMGNIENPGVNFVSRLAGVNIFLVLFNLIPGFPMDGGRVLRALLALRLGRRRATEIAAQIGQALAFGFGFLGLFSGNAILVFIAIFVYLAASAEAGQVGLMDMARRIPVERSMVRTFERLGVQATLNDAAEALLRTTQSEFPVVDGGERLRGFLTRDALVRSLGEKGPAAPVLESMVQVPTITVGQMLAAAVRLMQENRIGSVGVTGPDGRFLGYVSQENLSELMMLESSDWHRATPQPPRR